MNGFRETASLTNERTDGRDSLGLQRLRRETKKSEKLSDIEVVKLPPFDSVSREFM